MERAAAIIVGSVGALVLIIGALFWVSTRGPQSERGVDLMAAVAAVDADAADRDAGDRDAADRDAATGSSDSGNEAVAAVQTSAVPGAGSSAAEPNVGAGSPSSSVTTTSGPAVTSGPAATPTTSVPGPSPTLRALLERVDQGGVRFAYRSAELDDTARRLLDEVALQLRREPNVRLRIVGHTDSDGDQADNEALSAERARTVIAYLVGQGVAAEQLSAVARGELEPLAPNDSDAGRAANRRSELELEGSGS